MDVFEDLVAAEVPVIMVDLGEEGVPLFCWHFWSVFNSIGFAFGSDDFVGFSVAGDPLGSDFMSATC